MKTMMMMTKFNFLSLAAGLFILLAGCDNGNYAETEFFVRGNCGMCEDRIEASLEELDGVKSADWDVNNKLVTVKYDPSKLTESDLHAAPANAGHETKQVEANEEAHANLPACCKRKGSEGYQDM